LLQEINIANFALIDRLNIKFNPGLNILTGETGAGKSIIVDAVNLVLGERASKEHIRTGAEEMILEASFSISGDEITLRLLRELGLDNREEENTLILSREIARSGRSSCRINGRLTTLSILKTIGQRLVDIHGQHEHQSLLKTEMQLDLLDSFAGEKAISLRSQVREMYLELRGLKQQLSSLRKDARERARQEDLLRFQLEEINEAKLRPNEEEELGQEREILANAEKLYTLSSKSYDLLGGEIEERITISDSLGEVASDLEEMAEIDNRLSSLLETLNSAIYSLEDMTRGLRDYRDRIEFNPERLNEIGERLHLINNLKRKYGNNIKEILEYRDKIAKELDALTHNEELIVQTEEQIQGLQSELGELAWKLYEERKRAAVQLEEDIQRELADLGMDRVAFQVSFEHTEDERGIPIFDKRYKVEEMGIDEVEFLLSPNPGEEMKPLAKIASGGEMSRIMLALKSILAQVDQIPTLIFDEIDTGIGGTAAGIVADKLKRISQMRQVICVSHLPQIASRADSHYLIWKETKEGRTRTMLHRLPWEERVEEIARMLGGVPPSEITRRHAEEILSRAKVG